MAEHQLGSAQDSLRKGDTRSCARQAQAAFAVAVQKHDRHRQARALLLLAQALMVEARMQRAHHAARQAVDLFRELADPLGEAEALNVASYVDSALGRDAEALAAATRSVTLASAQGAPLAQAAGLNYYGVAAFWARDFGTARGVLDASRDAARAGDPGAAPSFHPLANAAFTEVLRVTTAPAGAAGADLGELSRLTAQCGAMAARGAVGSLTGVGIELGLLLLEFMQCFLASRSGRPEAAEGFYLACRDRAAQLPRSSWLHGLVRWARLERTLAGGDASAAIAPARALREFARTTEHEHLRQLAAALQTDVLLRAQRGERRR